MKLYNIYTIKKMIRNDTNIAIIPNMSSINCLHMKKLLLSFNNIKNINSNMINLQIMDLQKHTFG